MFFVVATRKGVNPSILIVFIHAMLDHLSSLFSISSFLHLPLYLLLRHVRASSGPGEGMLLLREQMAEPRDPIELTRNSVETKWRQCQAGRRESQSSADNSLSSSTTTTTTTTNRRKYQQHELSSHDDVNNEDRTRTKTTTTTTFAYPNKGGMKIALSC